MKGNAIKRYLTWGVLPVLVGALSGYLTRNNVSVYEELQQPPLMPPAAVFPVVWTILFVLMGIGAARVAAQPKEESKKALAYFCIQLVFNFFWSIIFFNLQAYGFAFIWLLLLWVLILQTVFLFAKADRVAGLLLVPYLLWVSFAAYLNLTLWLLNR